jgi:hypothetical protein
MRLLKRLAKQALYAIAPRAAVTVMSMRARAHSQKLVRQWGLYDLNQRLIGEQGSHVLAGPFAGLVLSPMTHEEHIGPYLLGTYEAELHPWIEELSAGSFPQVVDVGSKFGYYAVGLARMFPRAEVVAFDTDPWARDATLEMVRANGTDRVEVRGFCSPDWFDRNLRDGALIISDCEGFERDLFPAVRSRALESATLLIELHEAFAPGASKAIAARFAETHQTRAVQARPETMQPELPGSSLTAEDVAKVSQEVRGPQEWLLLTPRAGSVAAA